MHLNLHSNLLKILMMPSRISVFLLAFLVACQSPRIAKSPKRIPPIQHLDEDKLAQMDRVIEKAIGEGKTPGGVLWIERKGQIYQKAFGNRAVFPMIETTLPDTIYDLASLTKVIATAPSIVKLHEQGHLNIHDPVAKHIPAFAVKGKDQVSIAHLLTHTSGLPPSLPLQSNWMGKARAIELACAQSLQNEPGAAFVYSDVGFILLGKIVEEVSGSPLDDFAKANFYQPLGMIDTGFLQKSNHLSRIAPTTKTEKGVKRGIVHDPTAERMGGVAGHAGLFSTAKDLAQFARMLLAKGRWGKTRILKSESIDRMTRKHSFAKSQRALGWDIASPYSSPRGEHFELGSYGHTGWTGTSIWIDPFSESFVLFLSNRNHPTESGNVIALRHRIGTLAAEAILDYDFEKSQKKNLSTLNGIDVLKQTKFAELHDLSLGLITNHTGQSREKESTIDLIRDAEGVHLVALFSPEHGLGGDQDGIIKSSQTQNGIPIYSLYGKNKKPTPAQLKGLDALIFDIQDIGCRFYTYISTLGLAMEAAAQSGIRFIVLDRPNPISGSRIEGPLLKGQTSFVGYHSLPIRHGMTVGELAKLFAKEKSLALDLTIIPLKNWHRRAWFDETGIDWIDPSPNMKSLTAAAFYPGIGLLEMTALSVGRGTDTPFEIIGAPYINSQKLAREINRLKLPGLAVHPIRFTPVSSTFANELCHGIAFEILDRDQFAPIPLGLHLARILHRDYSEHFDLNCINRLLMHDMTLKQLYGTQTIYEIEKSWLDDLDAFYKRRAPHLLY